MTDNNIDTHNISTEPVVEAPSKKSSRLFVVVTILSIVLSVCALAGAYYLYKINLSNNIIYTQQTQQLNSQIESQAALQNTQFQQSQSITNDFKTKVEQLNLQLIDLQNKNKLYS